MSNFCYTLVHNALPKEEYNLEEFKRSLDSRQEKELISTMKKILVIMVNGNMMENLLMHVVRNVLPSNNKELMKLFYTYLEIIPKTENGKLKQPFILTIDKLRRDLNYPNEYVQGAVLRLLCKIKEVDILEPLIDSVIHCLDHRCSYVRKIAVFTVSSIYEVFSQESGRSPLEEAPRLIEEFLEKPVNHNDDTCKRNAFIVLGRMNEELAIEYIKRNAEQVGELGELLQLAFIDFIRTKSKTHVEDPYVKRAYIHIASTLLYSESPSVKYDAANALITLSSKPAYVKATAECYIQLITTRPDNDVLLTILGRLDNLRTKHPTAVGEFATEILPVLNCPDIEVRRKAIGVVLGLVTSKNAKEVVLYLKKELKNTGDQKDNDTNSEYQQLLIQSIHTCAIKFLDVAKDVIDALIDLISDTKAANAVEIIEFIREAVEKLPEARSDIINLLLSKFQDMSSGKVFRGTLWIIGEYIDSHKIDSAWDHIEAALGKIPMVAAEEELLRAAETESSEADEKAATEISKGAHASTATRVLPDGTYASESAYTSKAYAKVDEDESKPPLRALIFNGDYFLGSVLATTLTKLVLRYASIEKDTAKVNSRKAKAMLIMTSIIRIGQSQFVTQPIDEDSYDHILQELRVIGLERSSVVNDVYLKETRAVYSKQVEVQEKRIADDKAKEEMSTNAQIDDVITFRQLVKKSSEGDDDEYTQDVLRATGFTKTENHLSKLQNIIQLTGLSENVYAEVVMTSHALDLQMEFLIVNQTRETLQNVTIELSKLADTEGITFLTVGNLPAAKAETITKNIKVQPNDLGTGIFGNIVYDLPGKYESNCVVMKDIPIDFINYIKPATCNKTQFQNMWTEFEWENKVNVNTEISDLREYLNHLMASTNFGCLTPAKQLEGDCGFLSANLYARSVFGDDALANLSIEKAGDGPIVGHIRIRSKTQNIALGLGDKITAAQKTIA